MMPMLYAAIAAAVLSAFGTWRIQEWRHDSMEKDRIEQAAKEAVRRADKIDVAAVGHEKDKREIATEYVVITERIEDAKQTEFYAAGAPACLDPAGVRIVNDAARSRDAASQPAGALPRPAAAAGRSAGNRP